MLLEEKITLDRFPSWCNVFDNNVDVLDGKLPYESYQTLTLLTVQCFKNES